MMRANMESIPRFRIASPPTTSPTSRRRWRPTTPGRPICRCARRWLREGAGWARGGRCAYGPVAGGELMELGFAANENKPRFRPFDRYGHRIDEVEFHPAYHRLMELGIAHGVPNFAWRHAGTPGAHVARAALMYLHGQAEQGTCCPMTMTYASVPVLQHAPGAGAGMAAADHRHRLRRPFAPRMAETRQHHRHGDDREAGRFGCARQHDARPSAQCRRRQPALRTGRAQVVFVGADVRRVSGPRADRARAILFPVAALCAGRHGHNARNAIRIQRLKDKLGDWSNASAEVEFQGAVGWLIGEEGRGVATILEMVALTRQDCMIGSAAIMRQALVQAIHHARHRKAFGKLLIEQPLMQNVLADLALESEAALALALRVARAVDASPRDAREAAFARIATAIGKYWVCKRCPPFVNEAQECLGGAGYVEESILPRLYRQAPLNSIWEGSGNIQCLDVLRALLKREPETREALFAEFHAVKGAHPRLDAHVARLANDLRETEHAELRSRALVEAMAIGLQAAQLLRMDDRTVGDSFCEARLGDVVLRNYGTLPPTMPFAALIARAY